MSSTRMRNTVNASSPRRRQRGLGRPAQMALVAMGSVLLIYAQAVAALGVGEPRYLSHLFEPLRVEVPVDTRGVDPPAVKVGIQFSGLDPAAAAEIESHLHREWHRDARGQYVLRISTDQPIHEPLMQMRVEVGDDRIQAIRELTLLLDPAPVEVPAASLLAEVEAPAAVDAIAEAAPVDAVAPTEAAEPTAAAAIEPISITRVEPLMVAAPSTAPAAALAAAPRAVVAAGDALSAPPVAAAPVRRAATVAPVVAAAPVVLPPKALLKAPALLRPLADASTALLAAEPVMPAPAPRMSRNLSAQIESTHRPQALSAADRWQRLSVERGDTLDSLAARARGEQTTIPLPMVAMLLRWLNPRSFDGVGREPLVGAELRFPKPESLAAQIAISGGVWTVDDVTARSADAAATVVPPPSFQVLNPDSARDLAAAMGAGGALLAARPAPASGLPPSLGAGRATTGGLAASSTLVGGAVVAGVLSMLLMLNMVVTTPAPQAARYVPATVVARTVTAPATAAAAETRVLPAERLDLAALDLAGAGQADAVRQRAPHETRARADS